MIFGLRENRLTVRFSDEEYKRIKDSADKLGQQPSTRVREIVAKATSQKTYLNLDLTEGEWQYLQTVATHNKCSLETAVRLIMEGYYTLLNMPLSKSIKPLGELREEFQKAMSD